MLRTRSRTERVAQVLETSANDDIGRYRIQLYLPTAMVASATSSALEGSTDLRWRQLRRAVITRDDRQTASLRAGWLHLLPIRARGIIAARWALTKHAKQVARDEPGQPRRAR